MKAEEMNIFDKLERRLGFLTIHNLTLYIVVGQAIMFGLLMLRQDQAMVLVGKMAFSFDRFMAGEVWRIVTFMLIPRTLSIIWIIFALLIFQMMGNSLEQLWGAFRYNVYLFVGVLGVLFTGAIFPYYPITNVYIMTTVFFAFAYLNPNYEFMIFFILPVKVKWLGLLALAFILFDFFRLGPEGKVAIIGSIINFPLFFGRDIVRSIKSKKRVTEMKQARKVQENEPFHTCTKCGATDISAPDREFRYRKGNGAICSVCLAEEEE